LSDNKPKFKEIIMKIIERRREAKTNDKMSSWYEAALLAAKQGTAAAGALDNGAMNDLGLEDASIGGAAANAIDPFDLLEADGRMAQV
jgi:hypothetical protein